MAQRTDETIDPGGPGVPGGAPIRRDATNPTHFGGDPRLGPQPFIDPRIADPAALKYAQSAEMRRRQVVIPRNAGLVAGGADVMIPRLDSDPVPGLTMREQAQMQRAQESGAVAGLVAGMAQPAIGGIVSGTEHQQASAAELPKNTRGEQLTGLLTSDTLPDVVMKDPTFQTGGGSMMAVNQPHLARKYGVIRDGKHVPAQALVDQQARARQIRAGGTGNAPAGALKPETLEGLQALQDFNQARQTAENPSNDARVEQSALRGPAGGAGETKPPMTEAEKRDLLDSMDAFDVSRTRNALLKDLLNNDDQRDLIEKRLKPLDLGDLILTGRVQQRVPISPGVFEPVFQSYAGEEDLFIKRIIGEEVRQNEATDQYALDKYTYMGLTISVHSIYSQGKQNVLPSYCDASGEFNEDAFWKKYAVVSKWNYHMLSSLAANWFWFDIRVRKLFRAETLGNG